VGPAVRLVGQSTANASGDASFQIAVPGSVPFGQVVVQAGVVAGLNSALSDAVTLSIDSTVPPTGPRTSPVSGAVSLPTTANLNLPFAQGHRVQVISGYSPYAGSSLHDGTDRTGSTNDYYALDLNLPDEPNDGYGAPVLAPMTGTVVAAGWATAGWENYGQRVVLSHNLGDGHVYQTMYAHLASIGAGITPGASVNRGEPLGTLGSSCLGALSCASFSTPHVHFAVHQDASFGGSGTGGSYGGHAVVPEWLDGYGEIGRWDVLTSTNTPQSCGAPCQPTDPDACAGLVNGLWCDGDDLITCAAEVETSRQTCTNGCQQMPFGTPDQCATGADPGCQGLVNGLWCDGNDLIYCSNQQETSRQTCANGCEQMPFGTPDQCASPADPSCQGLVNGLWCDGNDLIYCSNQQETSRQSCANGCEQMPLGTADRCYEDAFCDGLGNGWWCDGDDVVYCWYGSVSSRDHCTWGCHVMPAGTPDECW